MVLGTYAQTNVNSYKYVVVPKKFDFLAETNEYQLNSTTAFWLKRYGFNTIIEGSAYPEDLARNNCKALYVDVIDNSGLFVTKFNVELKDCRNNVVFRSTEGRSKVKDYRTAYQESLRDAFKGFEVLNYKYDSSQAEKEFETQETVTIDKPAVIEVKEDPKPIEVTTSTEKDTFTFNSKSYVLKNEGVNMMLLDTSNKTSFGMLKPSALENVFHFKSKDVSGIGYMDNDGNVVVEYLSEDDEKKMMVFKKKLQ